MNYWFGGNYLVDLHIGGDWHNRIGIEITPGSNYLGDLAHGGNYPVIIFWRWGLRVEHAVI